MLQSTFDQNKTLLAKLLIFSLLFSLLFSGSMFVAMDKAEAAIDPLMITKDDLHWDPDNGDLYSIYDGEYTQWQDKDTYWKTRMGGPDTWSKFTFEVPYTGTYEVHFIGVPSSRGSIMDIIINGEHIGTYNHAGDPAEVMYGEFTLNEGINQVQFNTTGSNGGVYYYQQIQGFKLVPKMDIIPINKIDLEWEPENGDLYSLYDGQYTQWQDKDTYWKTRMGAPDTWSKFRFDIPFAGTYKVRFKAVPTSRGSIMDIIINGQNIGSYNHAGDPEEVMYGDVELIEGLNEVQFVVTGSNGGVYYYQQIVGFDFLPPGESIHGEHYGSGLTLEATGNPLGGGEGYSDIISVTEATYTVSTLEELEVALNAASVTDAVYGPEGNEGFIIYINDDAEIDMSSRASTPLKVPGNITIASGRGNNGSLGGKLFTTSASSNGLFKTTGPDVRFTGLRIEGDDPERHDELNSSYDLPLSQGIYSEYYLEVDNSEISAFSLASIRANNAYIHHNHMHHNLRKGLGYSIALDHMPPTDGHVLAEGNLFEHFRHAIAGMGAHWERYEARYNTFKDGTLHHLDQHSVNEGKTLPEGGLHMAGEWIKIHHNTFYDDFQYYSETQKEKNRPHRIIYIRGIPFEGVFIDYNHFPDVDPIDASYAMSQNNSYGNFFVGKNKYGSEEEIIEGHELASYTGKYPAPSFNLSNATFTGRSGQSVSSFSETDGFINVSARIANENRQAYEVTFIVAVKDAGGQVKDIAKVTKTLAAVSAETIEVGFELPDEVSGYSVEIFAWNNMEEMYPVTDVITFE
jgi:hypothetical protein